MNFSIRVDWRSWSLGFQWNEPGFHPFFAIYLLPIILLWN